MLKQIISILLFLLICITMYSTKHRCCYNCDFDDDFTVLGCPVCPNGYPCIYPCYGAC